MGKVVVKDVILRNVLDEANVANQLIPKNRLREVKVDMIADIGARAVSLPMSLVEELGLKPNRKIFVTLSDGSRQERMLYEHLKIQIGDRQSTFECLGKPENAPCLLGYLVFEALDLVVDCNSRSLIPNLQAPEGSMLYEDF